MRSAIIAAAVLATGACTRSNDTGSSSLVTVTQNEFNPNLMELSWSTGLCEGAEPRLTLEPADGTVVRMHMDDPRLLAFGLPPETDYDYVLELLLDGEACESASGSFRTGPSAPGAPSFEVDVPATERHGYLLTTQVTDPTGAVLLDTAGRVLWFWPDDETIGHVTTASLAPDRRSVIFGKWVDDEPDTGNRKGELVRVGIDGTIISRLPTLGMHHDLVERPDGKIAYLGTRAWAADGDPTPWRSDLLMEFSSDEGERVVWDATSLFPFDPASSTPTEEQLTTRDWTHANAIEYVPEQRAYLVSMRWQSSVVKIDEVSGDVLWVFGGARSDFTLLEGRPTTDQHGIFFAAEPPARLRQRSGLGDGLPGSGVPAGRVGHDRPADMGIPALPRPSSSTSSATSTSTRRTTGTSPGRCPASSPA